MFEWFNSGEYEPHINLVRLGQQQCKPGHMYASVRTYYLLHFVTDGKGKFTAGGRTYDLTAGQCFAIFPGEHTSYRADSEQPWSYFWLAISGSQAKGILKDCNIDGKNRIIDFDIALKDFFGGIYPAIKQSNFNKYTMTGLIYMFFSHLSKDARKKSSADILFDDALLYIHENYMQNISISLLAKRLFIDRTYLHKLFVSRCGAAPYEYVKNYRLERAKYLLKSSNLSVTEIAGYTGFLSISSFNKAFKKSFGLSPSAYRKQTAHLDILG